MRKLQSGFTAFELFIAVFVLLGVGGWVANVVKLIGSNFDPITGLVIARCIGVVLAPLGSVLGFI